MGRTRPVQNGGAPVNPLRHKGEWPRRQEPPPLKSFKPSDPAPRGTGASRSLRPSPAAPAAARPDGSPPARTEGRRASAFLRDRQAPPRRSPRGTP